MFLVHHGKAERPDPVADPLDLTCNELLVCRDPVGGKYLSVAGPKAGECVRPVLLPGIAWRLAEGKTWSVPF